MSNFVISSKELQNLAIRVAKKLDYKYSTYELRVFADGESKITIKKIKSDKTIIIHSISPPVDSNLIRILSLIHEANKHSNSVIAVIPYMGYARQDKMFLSGEIITIEVISKLLESVGASAVIVLDIHSNSALQKFNVPIVNISVAPTLAKYIKKLKLTNSIIVSPDSGGSERAKYISEILNVEHIVLKKQRDRKTGMVRIRSEELNINNRNIILVDDMITTGNSIINAVKILKKNKCGKIFVVCTHAILLGDAKNKIIKSGVEKIISANTITGNEIIDVTSLISKSINNMIKKL
ncbi:MAG: ribose-phosphate pyrophosphokinase [Nitrosopumilaceae archaeon]|nr:ribose-phosphate pyrophosphokinase [Nitrosopumilaceae archaeon]